MFCLIFTVRVSSADFICENEATFALIWSKDCATEVNRSIGYSVFTTEEKNIITYRTAKAICIRECLNVNFPCSQKGRWFIRQGIIFSSPNGFCFVGFSLLKITIARSN